MYTLKFAPLQKDITELDCSSTASLNVFVVAQPMELKRIAALVTTVMSSTGTILLTFFKRPTFGSTSGEASLGTITIPATAAVGGTYYKELNSNTILLPGQCLVVKVTTAATTSGKCCPLFEAQDAPEVPANMSSMIASA